MQTPSTKDSENSEASNEVVSISLYEMEKAGLLTSVAPHLELRIKALIALGDRAGICDAAAECDCDAGDGHADCDCGSS